MSSKVRVRLPSFGGAGGGSGLTSVAKWLALGGFVLGGLVALYLTFTVYVEPNRLAVRQIHLGPDKGISQDKFGPGLHFVMPFYERLHTFPRSIQLLEFNDDKISASEGAHHQPSIRIQTSEGYQVTVDVTVVYRISDPYKVITSVGPGRAYETMLVVPRSDRVLRQTLGELNAEEFYQGNLRQSKAEKARKLLTAEIAESGIQVWRVMVRHFTYDDRYQEAIEQRKIQDQTVFKNRAEAIAASREAEKNRVTAEGQANVDVERERGRAEVKKIEADADLYYRQRVAEGDLLVALAEAQGTRLQNAALQTAGASNMVGVEMAEVLGGAEVIIVPTDGPGAVNPLNLEQMMRGW